MPVSLQTTGTVTPLVTVDVKPQTTSVVTKVHIKEGQFVQKGDLLFSLDARSDEANLTKAKAQLTKDQAAWLDAQRQWIRNKELVAKGFIAPAAADTSQSSVEALAATVAADKASVEAAQIGLSYSHIRAPQAGRIGFINVFVGSAVQANQTVLLTITQLDPIAISFSLPQNSLPDALQAIQSPQGTSTSVSAKLPGGATLSGTLRVIDNVIDAQSGTIKMKAVFNNKDHKLWPGGFADITFTSRTLDGVTVVPQSAIIQSAKETVLYMVEHGKAVLRPIQVVLTQGSDAVVRGVKVDEVVVVEGKQNLRPNAPVIERTPTPSSTSTGSKSS